MWQLGTLVGAPVGIGLVAGIAVPAMIIGIPVWVGRKIHNRMKDSSRHKRNVAVTGGVLAAVVISPVLAGLAVGLGVPVLLAYVYGVVPISLCRSGGCGLSTSASGVRIDFDEDSESLEPSAVITHNGLTRQSTRSNGESPEFFHFKVNDSTVVKMSKALSHHIFCYRFWLKSWCSVHRGSLSRLFVGLCRSDSPWLKS